MTSTMLEEQYPSLQHYYSPAKSEPETQCEELSIDYKLHAHSREDQIDTDIQTEHRSKVKSSLCRNFMQNGYCPYGSKCQFAHGPQELRCNTHVNTSYKTKPCHAFLKRGYCCYGFRCNFLHKKQPYTQIQLKDRSAKMMQNFKDIIEEGRGSRLIQILK